MRAAHAVTRNATPLGFALLQIQLEVIMGPWGRHAQAAKPVQCHDLVSFLLLSTTVCLVATFDDPPAVPA